MQNILNNPRKPDITFFYSGRIDITSRVVKQLGMQEGDSINIGSSNEGHDYFLYIQHRHDKKRPFSFDATVRPTKVRSNNFRAYSSKLCRGLLEIYDAAFKVAPQLGCPMRDDDYGVVIPLIGLINLVNDEP